MSFDRLGNVKACWPLLDPRLCDSVHMTRVQRGEVIFLQAVRMDAWESVVLACMEVEVGRPRDKTCVDWCSKEAVRNALRKVKP